VLSRQLDESSATQFLEVCTINTSGSSLRYSQEAGVTVAELSEQLLMSAKGIKASVETLAAYRERMLTAIRIVMRGP